MKQIVTNAIVLLLLVATLPPAFAASDEDRERQLQRERQKLEKEKDPVDRAKIAIKISEILLDDVADAVRAGKVDEMELQLAAYSETIESAHQTLVDSGRNASKKPGGFKELEIALRKHTRKFEEFARMLGIQSRVPLEKAKDFVVGVQKKLLKALFP
jgi:hypothetical protein